MAMIAGALQTLTLMYSRARASTSALAGDRRNAAAKTKPCRRITSAPPPRPMISERVSMAATSLLLPAPCAWLVSPVVPILRKPKIQYTAVRITAPIPTAPIGAASPICPTTAVSTAPRIGTVALEITIGTAILRTRPWVTTGSVSTIPPGHQEMPGRLRERARTVVLPRLDPDAGVTPARPVDMRPCVGISRQARPEVIHSEINGLWQSRHLAPRHGGGIEVTRFDLFPKDRPAQPDDRGDLEKGRGRSAVQRGQDGVADQFFRIGHDRRQFIAAAVEFHAQEPDIGHAADQGAKRGVAALLDYLHRVRSRIGHRSVIPHRERAGSGRHGPFRVVVKGTCAHEGDGAGNMVTFSLRADA